MTHLLRTIFVIALVLGRTPVAAAAFVGNSANTQTKQAQAPVSQASKRVFKHSLSGLYAIDNLYPENLQQPHAEFSALYALAQPAQQELSNLLNEIAMLSDAQPIIPAVKSAERAEYKIATELEGQTEKITDLARGTLVADDIAGVVTAFEYLGKEAEIVRVKNRFKHPAASGYRDLSVLVRLPETKMIAEVQVHLRDIATIKSGEEHDIYEEIQQMERHAVAQARVLNDIEVAKIARLRQRSQDLYQEAWQKYLQPSVLAV
ncbi:RelA/SpoT domain-containing protein [Thaumasiovibrio subtropicus]|uniref:RelA/SpoT domain-containing protein n=1 Tax=Thaumasiovibrio subtropicus TaxID=1891207 RepID=UPI000B3600FD|nr:RelA/SpoT domain-containing protein [Thaumasiovibrio subtropicus]